MFRRVKRGLSGYVSYLAACEMNKAFSEYVLYEPILRILVARGFEVESEFQCPGIIQPRTGDKKKLDFVAVGKGLDFAIEVKWARRSELNVESDILKLDAFRRSRNNSRGFLCVFGKKSVIAETAVREFNDPSLAGMWLYDFGDIVIADLGQTRYGCRIFELLPM